MLQTGGNMNLFTFLEHCDKYVPVLIDELTYYAKMRIAEPMNDMFTFGGGSDFKFNIPMFGTDELVEFQLQLMMTEAPRAYAFYESSTKIMAVVCTDKFLNLVLEGIDGQKKAIIEFIHVLSHVCDSSCYGIEWQKYNNIKLEDFCDSIQDRRAYILQTIYCLKEANEIHETDIEYFNDQFENIVKYSEIVFKKNPEKMAENMITFLKMARTFRPE